jgi:hypothetical protein
MLGRVSTCVCVGGREGGREGGRVGGREREREREKEGGREGEGGTRESQVTDKRGSDSNARIHIDSAQCPRHSKAVTQPHIPATHTTSRRY